MVFFFLFWTRALEVGMSYVNTELPTNLMQTLHSTGSPRRPTTVGHRGPEKVAASRDSTPRKSPKNAAKKQQKTLQTQPSRHNRRSSMSDATLSMSCNFGTSNNFLHSLNSLHNTGTTPSPRTAPVESRRF